MRTIYFFFLLTFFTAHLDAFAGHRDATQAFPPRMQQVIDYVAANTPGSRFISLKSIKAAGKKCAEQALGHAPSEREMHSWWQQPAVLPTQQGPLAALAPLKKPVPLANPRYKLALCALFRDEARFLKEWIEYYLMLGVEHFYLLNHMSKDNPEAVLQPYIDRGLVTLTHDKRDPKKNPSVYYTIQNGHYDDILKKTADTVEWLACFDIDEYLVPLQDDTIVQLLERYPDYAAVSFNWVMYGTSGVQRVPDSKLMIETLNKRKGDTQVTTKMITRPRCTERVHCAHTPRLYPGFMKCVEDGTPFAYKEYTLPGDPQVARLHHYFFKDRDFIATKASWTEHGHKPSEWWEKTDAEYSAVEDTTIHRFVPEMRRRMGFDTSAAT